MLPIVVTKSLVAASANNIALSQTPTSGTAITLNGSTVTSGVATLDTQRRVLVTYGSEGSARTILFTGTNVYGVVIRETVAIPSGGGGTVATVQDFLTVTSALPGGGGFTAAITIGTNTVGSTSWISASGFMTPGQVQFQVIPTGTVNYTVEWTNQRVNPIGLMPAEIPTPFPVVALQAQTIVGMGATEQAVWWWRGTVNSGTGSIEVIGMQSGNAQGSGVL